MMLVVDPRSPVPRFEQVRAQVVALVRGGDLRPGARLPPVRRLAGDLGIAPNTVARAYRELEQGGVVSTRGRQGTFVNAQGDVAESEARAAAVAFVDQVSRLGLTPADAVRVVRAVTGETGETA